MTKSCKSCGNETFYEGKLSNYAALQPLDKVFSTGSLVKVTFCSHCGEVNSMKVEHPEKFRRTEK